MLVNTWGAVNEWEPLAVITANGAITLPSLQFNGSNTTPGDVTPLKILNVTLTPTSFNVTFT